MIYAKRYPHNPILSPNEQNFWESYATFNGCVVKDNNAFHLLYRAISRPQDYLGMQIQISSIGYATSNDGINFRNRRLLIKPEFEWEIFGCEDPRITKLNKRYFIFYTSISSYPPTPEGIKIGVAITEDLVNMEKHKVTFFNSKAMALFPQKIKGKIAGILTVNTDMPPAKICMAYFDEEEEIWSNAYWEKWFSSLDEHTILLPRSKSDQIEVGAPPIKTKHGWLLIYSYIKGYLSPPRTFGIEAALLDLRNPSEVIGKIERPLLVPEKEYELYGNVPNVIFPSGAILQNGDLFIYYGAADTTCCLALCDAGELIEELLASEYKLR
jgi:predicted GH43/DUF377 family glycosyl hydrolase